MRGCPSGNYVALKNVSRVGKSDAHGAWKQDVRRRNVKTRQSYRKRKVRQWVHEFHVLLGAGRWMGPWTVARTIVVWSLCVIVRTDASVLARTTRPSSAAGPASRACYAGVAARREAAVEATCISPHSGLGTSEILSMGESAATAVVHDRIVSSKLCSVVRYIGAPAWCSTYFCCFYA